MRAVSARHPSSPVPQEPLSSYSGSDRNYRTGTADPPRFADAGAGGWNSHPKTAAVRAEKVALVALIAQGATNLYPGPNATKHLGHYLQNTGLDYTVDLENMVRVVPSARSAMIAEFRLARAFLKTLPAGRHNFTAIFNRSGYDEKSENADWFFATGGYTRWGKGEAIISNGKFGRHYEVDFEYRFYDRYNWDGGKSVTIAGFQVTDETMGEFHRQGLAREYDCFGSIHRKLAWEGDFGAPDDSVVLKPPGR